MSSTIFSEYSPSESANNSFFSVPSVIARVSEIISEESTLTSLEELLSEYYIPAFTVNITSNDVTIGVFPLTGAPTTVVISRIGVSAPVVSSGAPEVPIGDEIGRVEKISPSDSVFGVNVDPAIHADSVIKRPLAVFETADEDDTGWFNEINNKDHAIETLFLSTFPETSTDDDKIVEAQTKLGIINDIVKDQINDFDPNIRDEVVLEYSSWLQKINKFSEFLTEVSSQQESLFQLVDHTSMKESYLAVGKDPNGPEGTLTYVWNGRANNLGRLLNAARGTIADDDWLKSGSTGLVYTDQKSSNYSWSEFQNSSKDTVRCLGLSNNSTDFAFMDGAGATGYYAYNDRENNVPPFASEAFGLAAKWEVTQRDFLNPGGPHPIGEFKEDLFYRQILQSYLPNTNKIVQYKSALTNNQFGDINEEILGEWYASEIDALIKGEESPQLSAAWLNNFDTIMTPLQRLFKTEIAGGAGLLVTDSIIRALNELVDDDLDVSEYIGRDEAGSSWLDLSFSSSVLGGDTVLKAFPNSMLQGVDLRETSSADVRNTRFLKYYALYGLLNSLRPSELKGGGLGKDEWWTEMEVKDWLIKEVLNTGDIEARSNTNLISLGDVVRSIGTTQIQVNNPIPYEFYDGEGGTDTGNGYWGSVNMYKMEMGEGSQNLSRRMDAQSLLGLNWICEYENRKLNANKKMGIPEQNLYCSPVNGLLNMFSVTNQPEREERVIQRVETIGDSSDLEAANKTLSDGRQNWLNINTSKYRYVTDVSDCSNRQHFGPWFKKQYTNNEVISGIAVEDFETYLRYDGGVKVIPGGYLTGIIGIDLRYRNQNELNFLTDLIKGYTDINLLDSSRSWLDGDKLGEQMDENSLWQIGHNVQSNLNGPALWDVTDTISRPIQYNANQNQREDDRFQVVATFSGYGAVTSSNNQIADALSMFNLDRNRSIEVEGHILPLEWKIMSKGSNSHSSRLEIGEERVRTSRAETSPTDIGWTLEDQIEFYQMKGGGAFTIFGSIEGIMKRLYVRSREILVDKINSMLGESLELSDLDSPLIIEEHIGLWLDCLFNTLTALSATTSTESEKNPTKGTLRWNHGGGLSVFPQGLSDNNTWPAALGMNSSEFSGVPNNRREKAWRMQDTLGDPSTFTKGESNLATATKEMMGYYLKMKSMVSTKNNITVSNERLEIDWMSCYPQELIRDSSNVNFDNAIGPADQYLNRPTPSLIQDPLVFTSAQIKNPMLVDEYIETPLKSSHLYGRAQWISTWGSFVQFTHLFDNIESPIRQFNTYVSQIEIEEDIRAPYEEGLITVDDISKSSKILPLVTSNLSTYRADANGISEFWKNLQSESNILTALEKFEELSGKFFIALIGLSEDFVQATLMDGESYYIDVDFETDGWWGLNGAGSVVTQDMTDYGIYNLLPEGDMNDPSSIGKQRRCVLAVSGGQVYFVDQDGTSDKLNIDSLQNKNAGLAWIHFIKGLRMDESVFVDDYDQIYSEFLQKNETKIFPWSESDFENDRAINDVESIYNVSPWLFPKNFYMDVIKPRDFRTVIPVLVKVPVQQEGVGYDTTGDQIIDDNDTIDVFQGNIKFKIFTNSGQVYPRTITADLV